VGIRHFLDQLLATLFIWMKIVLATAATMRMHAHLMDMKSLWLLLTDMDS
jgi:hypothetical protein